MITGSPTSDINGKAIARVGDKVTCPKTGCPSSTVIVSGDPTLIIDGKAVSRHGDKTACGATLIATQTLVTDRFGGSSSDAKEDRKYSNENGKSRGGDIHSEYDEQVILVQTANTSNLIGLPWCIETKDGRVFSGRVGPDGKLPRINTYGEEDYTVLWSEDAILRMETA